MYFSMFFPLSKNVNSVTGQLDAAVNRGLRRAQNDRVDTKKLCMLAAAGVFTFALCIAINLMPVSTVVEKYYQNR
jgi:hypothetical protein